MVVEGSVKCNAKCTSTLVTQIPYAFSVSANSFKHLSLLIYINSQLLEPLMLIPMYLIISPTTFSVYGLPHNFCISLIGYQLYPFTMSLLISHFQVNNLIKKILKYFCCDCAPLFMPYKSHKIYLTSHECLFIEYFITHKSYKCLSISGRFNISKDVQFNYSRFPYPFLFDSPVITSKPSSTSSFPLSVL